MLAPWNPMLIQLNMPSITDRWCGPVCPRDTPAAELVHVTSALHPAAADRKPVPERTAQGAQELAPRSRGEHTTPQGCARPLVTEPVGLPPGRHGSHWCVTPGPAALYPVTMHPWGPGGLPAGPPKSNVAGRQHLF